jgi:hypothetical protein
MSLLDGILGNAGVSGPPEKKFGKKSSDILNIQRSLAKYILN